MLSRHVGSLEFHAWSWSVTACICRIQAQNGPDHEYHQELEDAPANAQERFLDSLMSLRRSERFTSADFDIAGPPDLLSVFSKCSEEDPPARVTRNSLVVAPAVATDSMKQHV